MEFTLAQVIKLLYKRMLWIVLITALALAATFAVNKYLISESYTASVQFYVNTQDSQTQKIDLNELNYAQKVVNTYINFLKTKVFYNMLIEETRLPYTVDMLKDCIRITVVSNTEIFQVSVTTNSASDSFELAKAIQNIAPDFIKSIKNTTEISVVDPVVMPRQPSGPHVLLNTAIGGLMGFVLSVLLVFIWELIDVNVKDEEELKQRYNKPVIGNIPSYQGNDAVREKLRRILPGRNKNRQAGRGKAKSGGLDKIIDENTKFIITEAYRALRSNLRYTLRKDGCKIIMINSPMPEDGKSTTCANLGITMAQTGARVLLVDCDLRKGKLHRFFNFKSMPGLSDILSGLASETEVIHSTAYKNLHVLPMGSKPPNPAEMLASVHMEELIAKLAKSYDYIIIDTPPINVVSDVIGLVKLVDGMLIVVRQAVTSHPNIAGALSKYELVNANILGFVLNGVIRKQGLKSKSGYYYRSKDD
ncbi:MAG: polysaccharide biosynthesis tyrosine autokinase [Clostridiales bacterium]|nr:polysaccharide biosynthesis tyrosine autokinase [Clostridiales bacterium]